jgi:hypothetical protein
MLFNNTEFLQHRPEIEEFQVASSQFTLFCGALSMAIGQVNQALTNQMLAPFYCRQSSVEQHK